MKKNKFYKKYSLQSRKTLFCTFFVSYRFQRGIFDNKLYYLLEILNLITCAGSSKYLLLAECEIRTASYGPSFFLPFMAQARSAKRAGHENKEGKNEDP